ncbi:hypothetical protein B0H13DRAFT_1995016 [Mycena leptocephala]|nr:hypothetical protein B0H13DRAFT_1995016 [Mycena leptocephala]
MVCSICYEQFTAPVSLPCGHIFCHECVRRAVEAIPMYTMEHFCPTCRAGYNIVTIDTALVPPYLRRHILPTLRPVFFDDPVPSPESAPADSDFASTSAAATSLAKPSEVSVETQSLRTSYAFRRQRGPPRFARAAKGYALCLRAERDEALNRCALLESRLSQLLLATEVGAFAPEQGRPEHAELPAFLPSEPRTRLDDLLSPSPFAPPMSRRDSSPVCS